MSWKAIRQYLKMNERRVITWIGSKYFYSLRRSNFTNVRLLWWCSMKYSSFKQRSMTVNYLWWLPQANERQKRLGCLVWEWLLLLDCAYLPTHHFYALPARGESFQRVSFHFEHNVSWNLFLQSTASSWCEGSVHEEPKNTIYGTFHQRETSTSWH